MPIAGVGTTPQNSNLVCLLPFDVFKVTGLARSDETAAKLETLGVIPIRGSLTDLDTISSAAAATDGVVHCGFIKDSPDIAAASSTDRVVCEAIANAIESSGKKFIISSGAYSSLRADSYAWQVHLVGLVFVLYACICEV